MQRSGLGPFRRIVSGALATGVLVALAGSAVAAPARPGQHWAARYKGPVNGQNRSADVASSADGTRVYVTGWSKQTSSSYDFTTIAYDATNGHTVWTSTYNGPGNGIDQAVALALSADGSRLFVTGFSAGIATGDDYATVAYDATLGQQLWVARYDGPDSSTDDATAIGLAPDGSRVFVTGASSSNATGEDYATVAYDAVTGTQEWATRLNGASNADDQATALAVGPSGTKVFVTGSTTVNRQGENYGTVAYDTASGTQSWVARYDGPASGNDAGAALATSADGTKVFVTGSSETVSGGGVFDDATLAYKTTTGKRLWAVRYNGLANGDDHANAVAVSADDASIFVTGTSDGGGGNINFATVAYAAADGAQSWATEYDGPGAGTDIANDVGVSPDGTRVFVTGGSTGTTSGLDYATLLYDAVSGQQLKAFRYDHVAAPQDEAYALAVSADGLNLYVTGESGGGSIIEYATVAYGLV